jgi:hypothetical protein
LIIRRRVCDRCSADIKLEGVRDDIADFLLDEYPGRDICPSCDLQIVLESSCAARDVEENLPRGTSIRKVFEMYLNLKQSPFLEGD